MTMLEDIEELAKKASGISFILAMEDADGKVTLHPRNNQPCQGGETRKYFKTHGELCTQPENTKPRDLHSPFPAGKPVAIAFPKATFTGGCKRPELFMLIRDIMSQSQFGPFRVGLKGLARHRDGIGFTITDTHVDPTVMIQSIQVLRQLGSRLCGISQDFIDKLDPYDLLLLCIGWYDPTSSKGRGYDGSGYYWQPQLSPKRFFLGLPNDLSGGTYYDGYDYNRSYNSYLLVPDVDDPEVKGIKPSDINFKFSNVEDNALQLLEKVHKFMDNEPDPVIKPYKFRTYSGKTYDSHLDWIKEKKK